MCVLYVYTTCIICVYYMCILHVLYVCITCTYVLYVCIIFMCSKRTQCTPCSKSCRIKKQVIVKNCSTTQDSFCECQQGYFLRSPKDKRCERHRSCPPGMGVSMIGKLQYVLGISSSHCPCVFFYNNSNSFCRCSLRVSGLADNKEM